MAGTDKSMPAADMNISDNNPVTDKTAPEYHQELELRIETLTNQGLGLGRIDGWVVMVPFTIPGERVRARIFRNHKNYCEADLIEVLEAAPERVGPACPLFGQCGGCQYQHINYESQLQWKRRHVEETLERLGGISHPVSPTVPSPLEYGYRSKLTPHYRGRLKRPGQQTDVGFLRAGQRSRLVDVPHCPIAMESINQALPAERARAQTLAAGKKRGGTLLLRHTREGLITDPKAVVSEQIGALTYRFLAGEFFQNNPYILPALVEHVINEAAGGGHTHLVDAYCGVGVFALAGASRFHSVHGVEISERAVRWARANATENNLENCDFRVGDAESLFATLNIPGSDSAVILDPPRAGCGESFLHQLTGFGPARIVYVSCDPATQARDLKLLTAAGYVVQNIQPFDLFPQTKHIECVVTLTRNAD